MAVTVMRMMRKFTLFQLILAILLGHTFYTIYFNTKFEISDHENIGTDTFLVVIA